MCPLKTFTFCRISPIVHLSRKGSLKLCLPIAASKDKLVVIRFVDCMHYTLNIFPRALRQNSPKWIGNATNTTNVIRQFLLIHLDAFFPEVPD